MIRHSEQSRTRRTKPAALRLAPLLACCALLSGCAVKNAYVRPPVAAPPAYKEAGPPQDQNAAVWNPSAPQDAASRGNWWEAFGDPRLNELETALNGANQNIAAAAAAVESARAVIRESRSQYLPTVTASPAIANARLSTLAVERIGAVYSQFSLPFEASWEPDLWGRVRNTVAATVFSAQTAAADLENVRLAAQADLATDYFELREQDEMKGVLDSTVAAFREASDLARVQLSSGIGNDETVAQAEAQWQAAEAQDSSLAVLRAQYEHAIAVLTGRPAADFTLAPQSAAIVPPAIPPGLPSQLLERRPDIAAAERAMAQANAQIGVAKTAFYPSLTLTASGGLQNLGFLSWLSWPSRFWSVGPSLAQTLFDAGLRRATVQQFQAAWDQTVATYRETVLTAFQQVEDNLAALRALSQVIDQQDAAIQSAARALDEATARYNAGLDPYLNVISARTILLNDRQAAVNFRLQQIVASVQLIKALGGGWTDAALPSPKDLQAKPAAPAGPVHSNQPAPGR